MEEGEQISEEWESTFSRALYRLSPESFKTSPHIVDYLGCGSFGHVRRCYHDEYDTVVAKCYNFAGKHSKALINVSREANILSKLYHDNIVKVLGITSWGNCIAIIMEHIDGGSLHELTSSKKIPDISSDISLCIIKQLACGLDYLHNFKNGAFICHGDLKPSNVLFTFNFVVKLADLGSANINNAEGDRGGSLLFESVQIKESGQYTLSYVAPEFLKDTKATRQPSMDIYSLSMIIYEMLTRKPVYFGSNEIALYANLLHGKLRPDLGLIDELKEKLSHGQDIFEFLKTTMIRCWDSEPSKRPLSSEILREASIQMQSCNGLVIHREWKKMTKILKGKSPDILPKHACVDLTNFNNQFIEIQSFNKEESVISSASSPPAENSSGSSAFRQQAFSVGARTPSPANIGSPENRINKHARSFTHCPAGSTPTTDPELYLQIVSKSSEKIMMMIRQKDDERNLKKQCNHFLNQLRARLPTRNHFTLTMNCLEIVRGLQDRRMFSLAVEFIGMSMSLYDVLKIGNSERQFWSEKISVTCRNLADEMTKRFKDDDVRDKLMPVFVRVLDKIRKSNIDYTAKVSSCHNILKHVVHVCCAIHDHSHSEKAAELCFEVIRSFNTSSPSRTNSCSTGQLCDYIGDIYAKLGNNARAQVLYNEAIGNIQASHKWTNQAMSKDLYIAAVEKKLREMQLSDEVFEPVQGEVYV